MSDAAFETLGLTGRQDQRGIVSLTIPYYCYTREEMLTVGAGSYLGLDETDRTFSSHDDGNFLAYVTYEGTSGGDGDGRGKDGETISFESSFSEEPIETHPEIESLKTIYAGTYDAATKLISFAEFLSGKTGALSGGKKEKNPMFGVKTYLDVKAVFRRTYVASVVPSDILTSIGKVVSSLPTGMPTTPGRDWLIMPPKIAQRGKVYEITEELMMSKPGGWPKTLYGLITQ